LSEKKIAMWVDKSTEKYYELSSNTADHIEILVSEENPKLLKSLREELSLDINLAQNSIHQLLHQMASSQEIAEKNYIPDFRRISMGGENSEIRVKEYISTQSIDGADGRSLGRDEDGLLSEIKSIFKSSKEDDMKLSILASILPLFIVAIIGTFYLYQNRGYISKIDRISTQISAVKRSSELSEATKSIFNAVDGSGEIRKLMLSLKSIYIEGEAWGIPKLEANLKRLYPDGLFTIKTWKWLQPQ